MKFYSTKNDRHRADLREAVVRGLAPDGGLYMPENLPTMPPAFFQHIHDRSFRDIALEVTLRLLGDDINRQQLERIIDHTIQFDAPLVPVEKDIYALELFHGPTMAFKDFGARFMSQLLGFFAQSEQKEVIILAATSGDTGSAVANGFLGVSGTKVIVLYPSGKVSGIQEKQFTTLGKNITALEVDGTFDDCQRLVKEAFSDERLNNSFFLTSANSINIARLIPQMFYYFFAWAQAPRKEPVVFSVPSGNFGNLTAGLMAKKMGLPARRFVIATNANDVVPRFLQTHHFVPRPSTPTISNAMDVGNPSNFHRMMDLYQDDMEALKNDVVAYSFTDEETRASMRDLYRSANYVADPHGAIGYAGLKEFLKGEGSGCTGIFLETAHPGKFQDVVESTLNIALDLPEPLRKFMAGTKAAIPLSNNFDHFRELIKKVAG